MCLKMVDTVGALEATNVLLQIYALHLLMMPLTNKANPYHFLFPTEIIHLVDTKGLTIED